MEKAGFQEVAFLGSTPFKTSPYTGGALFRAVRKDLL